MPSIPSTAATVQPDEAVGLEQVLYLAEGAPVMLTGNTCQQAGLCCGCPGKVVNISKWHAIPPLASGSLTPLSRLHQTYFQCDRKMCPHLAHR